MMTYADTSKECGASQQAGNSWACETAAKTAEYGTLATAAAQQVGNVSLQLKGSQNMQRMNAQSGFSDMYETGAKNADAVAETNNIMKYTTGAIATAQTAAGLTALITNISSPDSLQQEAAEEHRTQGMKAIMSGVASGALAYQHHLQEEMAKNEAKALRKIRDGYRGIEDLQIGKNPDPLEDRGTESPFQNPFADMDSSKQGASGDFMTPEQYAGGSDADIPPPSLGEPINIGGGSGNNNGGGAPAPVAMGGAAPSGGGGGGGGFFGGGGGGGGGFSPSSADDEASGNAHQYAGIMNNPSKYSSGSSGGGGSKGGGAAGGVDLSSMLAKFLPGFGGKEDEKGQKKGILSFGKKTKDRGLASNARGRNPYDQDLSTIDRTRSLFDRVHMAYQLKQKENSL